MVARSMNTIKRRSRYRKGKGDEGKCNRCLLCAVVVQFIVIVWLFFFLTWNGQESVEETKGQAEVSEGIKDQTVEQITQGQHCLLYTSPSPRDQRGSRMPSSA